ncbi:Fused isobutyryl-CoA mutase [Streptomyces griseoloalbus]
MTERQKDRPWLMRTYAGHSTAEASNELYRRNLAKGQTGLSVAFDLPTQTGYDSDHVLARGEVGRVGVPVAHLGDMRRLFQDIPLEQMNTSMTINATAMWLLALYQVVAEEQGADITRLQGTTQNDIVKEYLSRGTHVFPPGPSLRLTTDMIAYTVSHIPRWNPINICSYHLQEAGATPVQEIAYAMSTAIAVLDAVRDSGQVPQERMGDDRVDVPGRRDGRRGRRAEPRLHHAAEGADAQQVVALDLLLTQIEKTMGFEVGRIGIEAQIENAQGLNNVNEIAQASPRLETIIFGPADFMASINMKSLVVGEQPPGYPADAYHYILMKILMAARANDLQAIDGPYLQIRNVDGYREVARRAAALGFDGKWVLHPGQVEASNEIFSPSQEDYDHAELILDAYEYYTSEAGGKKGSAMLGDEMIDEASRKMALVVAGKGRAAGMERTSKFEIPEA